MKIRMLIDIGGTFEGIATGVKRGDVVDVPDVNAVRYIEIGYAESASKSDTPVEAAVMDEAETATVESTPTRKRTAPKPLDEDDEAAEVEAAKARVASKRARR